MANAIAETKGVSVSTELADDLFSMASAVQTLKVMK